MTLLRALRFPAPGLLAASAVLASCGGDAATGPDGDRDATAQQPAEVRVVPARATLDFVGETLTLEAQVLSPAGLPLDRPVSWTSSAPAVATVSAGGVVTARGNGTARVEAASGGATGLAEITVRQLPRTLHVLSGDGQTGPVGTLLEAALVVEVRDEGGAPVADAALSWFPAREAGTLETASERTDGDGRGQARWRLGAVAGAHTLQVVMTGPLLPGQPPHTASVAFTAVAEEGGGPAPGDTVRVDAVAPAVLVEGEEAEIRGSGFGPTPGENSVVVDGLAASVLSASDSLLAIRVPTAPCRPPRSAALSVARGGGSDTVAVEITPPELLEMEPGEGWLATSGCLHLAGGDGARQYLVGIQSTATSAGVLTPARLTARVGGTAAEGLLAAAADPAATAATGGRPVYPGAVGEARPGGRGGAGDPPPPGRAPRPRPLPPLRPPALSPGLPAPPAGHAGGAAVVGGEGDASLTERRARHRAAEAALRAREAEELRRLGGLGALQGASPMPRALAGATPGAGVPAVGDTLELGVGTGCFDRPTVKAVARHVGAETVWLEDTANPDGGFGTEHYRMLDGLYSAAVGRTLQDYFGSDRDVDGNGRLLVLVTRTVNEQRDILGYVWAGDLFSSTSCRTSNRAEIFYGIAPDPTGLAGDPFSLDAALAEYPALMAHEATHVVQRSEQIFGEAGPKERWETEGGATLAEQLAGHVVSGRGSGQDLGWTEVDTWRDWYLSWVSDLTLYYGYRAGRHVEGAPEECTWIGGQDEGNAGPCFTSRAVYGVPATLLRWVLDRHGPDHPGGEAGLMRAMTASPVGGYQTLEQATGEDIRTLLAGFYAALWEDGRYRDALPSWDLLDIFSHIPRAAGLVPYESAAAEPALELRVRGGSTGLLAWSPGTHGPTSLRLVAPGHETLPSWMAAWVVRLR